MKKSNLGLLFIVLLASCSQTNNKNTVLYSSEEIKQSSFDESTNETIDSTVFVNEDKEIEYIDDNYRNYYEIFVYSFADSNGDKIGDLNGITNKLDYLSSMGYTGIWLTPIFESNSYHKYDIKDYFSIDSDFGTMDDLKNLVTKAHSLNIKVILDGVFNHSSQYNDWFESSLLAHRKKIAGSTLTEEESNYDSLYVFYDSLDEAKKSNKTYYKAGGNDFYYEANFSSDMPEFNFDSEFTYTKIESVIDYYMNEIGVDGFRLDAVKYYKLNDTSENVKILSKINKMIKDNDLNGYCVGECYDSATTIEAYYKSDLDSYFYFPGASSTGFIASAPNNEGRQKMVYYRGYKEMERVCGDKIPAPFINNHDMARVSYENSPSSYKFILGLLGMLTGSTFTYYGDEIGMSSTNLKDGDYRDSSYRTHYYWDDETHSMECNDVPYSYQQNQAYEACNQQMKDENSILNYAKKINELRLKYPFIARGNIVDNDTEDETNNKTTSYNILTIKKSYLEKEYKILFNFSKSIVENYSLNDYKVKSVVCVNSSDNAHINNEVLELPKLSIAILEK